MTQELERRLLTRREAAAVLAVSLPGLDRLVQSGAIEVVRIDRRPRFTLEAVEALIEAGRVSPDDGPGPQGATAKEEGPGQAEA